MDGNISAAIDLFGDGFFIPMTLDRCKIFQYINKKYYSSSENRLGSLRRET
jgi:hypothetical protein